MGQMGLLRSICRFYLLADYIAVNMTLQSHIIIVYDLGLASQHRMGASRFRQTDCILTCYRTLLHSSKAFHAPYLLCGLNILYAGEKHTVLP